MGDRVEREATRRRELLYVIGAHRQCFRARASLRIGSERLLEIGACFICVDAILCSRKRIARIVVRNIRQYALLVQFEIPNKIFMNLEGAYDILHVVPIDIGANV